MEQLLVSVMIRVMVDSDIPSDLVRVLLEIFWFLSQEEAGDHLGHRDIAYAGARASKDGQTTS